MYADLEDLREYLRITDPADTEDDAVLTRALQAASAQIDHVCSRTFALAGEDPTTVYEVPVRERRTGRWVLPIPDLFDSTGLTVFTWDGSDWATAVDGWGLGPAFNAGPRPWTDLILPSTVDYSPDLDVRDSTVIAVTGFFGWPEVPPSIVQATLIQAARIAKRRDSPFGMVNTLDGSEQARLTRVLDPDVVVLLRGFIKYWAAR